MRRSSLGLTCLHLGRESEDYTLPRDFGTQPKKAIPRSGQALYQELAGTCIPVNFAGYRMQRVFCHATIQNAHFAVGVQVKSEKEKK